MNSCKHCLGVKKNEIGEQPALCEYSGEWKNVTLGSCFGNCESQEYTPDYIAANLIQLSDTAYDWNINGKVLGMECIDFVRLMDAAAEMIQSQGRL